jgi:ADP-heptose:LPS heptosyltransferase
MTRNARSGETAPAADPRDAPPASPHAGVGLRRILVIRFGRIGDILVLTPALRALARAHAGAAIDVLTTGDGVVTLAGNPHVRDVLELRARRLPRLLNRERARLVGELRARSYDAVFLLEGAERYRTLARDIGGPVVYGFARDGEADSATRVRRAPDRHEGLRFLDVLARAGIPAAGVHYDFHVDGAARAGVRTLLDGAGVPHDAPIAGIHAGHFQRRVRRGKPHAKTWPAERYAEVVRRLAARGFTVVLTGGNGERALNRRIVERTGGGAIDLAGRTDLRTLAALIERCAVFLAPDTGPAHLAAAVGTPLVALFGPKAPHIMGPLGDDARIVRLYPEPSREPAAARGGHHPRMWAIGVEDVMAAVERLLVATHPRPPFPAASPRSRSPGPPDVTGEAGQDPGGPPGFKVPPPPGHSHGATRRRREPGA